MHQTAFASDSLAETEAYLSEAYTPMRIGGRPDDTGARIVRRTVGELTVDELSFDYTMHYDAAPLDRLCLVSVHRGVHTSGEEACGPGETFLVAQPDRPYRGDVRSAEYTIVSFDPAHLSRVVGPGQGPVRLTGTRAISPAANRLLHATVGYLRDTVLPAVDNPAEHPLVAGTALRHLAAVTLSCLPHTTDGTEPARADSRDAHPDTLRRAISYIDDNAQRDIGLADIAAAAFVTPRALQYAFERHAHTTPLRYLRRVRLAGAHRELRTARQGQATVTDIAQRWGFANLGRFAAYHRQAYGATPAQTLAHPG